jgi:deoxyribose-phosphate aldolase
MTGSLRDLAKMIDHSLLHLTLTDRELTDGCALARRLDVASACIKPYAVPLARETLAGSDLAVGTVIGFPHGNSRVDVKLAETERALADGATEIDAVVNLGKVLSGDWGYVEDEICRLNALAVGGGGLLKLIFENDYVTRDEDKVRLCRICSEHAVAFVKTSTGYGFVRRPDGLYSYAGATDHDLALMRRASAPSVQVKAAGGVRTLDDLLRVRGLGATRAGATATEAILAEAVCRGYR